MESIHEATRQLYDYANGAVGTFPRYATSPRSRTISFASAIKPTKSPHAEFSEFHFRSSPRRRRWEPPFSLSASGKASTRISPKRKAAMRSGSGSFLGTLLQPLNLAKRKRQVKNAKSAFWKSRSTSDIRPRSSGLEPLQAGGNKQLESAEYDEDYDDDFDTNGPPQYLTIPSRQVENPFLTPRRPNSLYNSAAMSETQSPPLSPLTNSPSSVRSSAYRRQIDSEKRKAMSRMKAIQLLGVEALSAVKIAELGGN